MSQPDDDVERLLMFLSTERAAYLREEVDVDPGGHVREPRYRLVNLTNEVGVALLEELRLLRHELAKVRKRL